MNSWVDLLQSVAMIIVCIVLYAHIADKYRHNR